MPAAIVITTVCLGWQCPMATALMGPGPGDEDQPWPSPLLTA